MIIPKEKIIKKTLRNHNFQKTMETLIMRVYSNISSNIKVASQVAQLLSIIIDRAAEQEKINKDTALAVNHITININLNKGHLIKITEHLTNIVIILSTNNTIVKVIIAIRIIFSFRSITPQYAK